MNKIYTLKMFGMEHITVAKGHLLEHFIPIFYSKAHISGIEYSGFLNIVHLRIISNAVGPDCSFIFTCMGLDSRILYRGRPVLLDSQHKGFNSLTGERH